MLHVVDQDVRLEDAVRHRSATNANATDRFNITMNEGRVKAVQVMQSESALQQLSNVVSSQTGESKAAFTRDTASACVFLSIYSKMFPLAIQGDTNPSRGAKSSSVTP